MHIPSILTSVILLISFAARNFGAYLETLPKNTPSLATFKPTSKTDGHHLHNLTNSELDLHVEESRNKNRRQSYNHKSPSKRHHYQTHNRHSDGGRKGKGGYYKTDSYKGNRGYSDATNYSRANKNSYADEDHKTTGNKRGGHYGGSKSGGNEYGGSSGHSGRSHRNSGDRFGGGYRGKYASDYSDNGNSYLNAGGGEY